MSGYNPIEVAQAASMASRKLSEGGGSGGGNSGGFGLPVVELETVFELTEHEVTADERAALDAAWNEMPIICKIRVNGGNDLGCYTVLFQPRWLGENGNYNDYGWLARLPFGDFAMIAPTDKGWAVLVENA